MSPVHAVETEGAIWQQDNLRVPLNRVLHTLLSHIRRDGPVEKRARHAQVAEVAGVHVLDDEKHDVCRLCKLRDRHRF